MTTTTMNNHPLIGKMAFVSVATKGDLGPGEVTLTGGENLLAWSKDPLPKGTQTVITAERGIRTVSVDPL